MNEKRDCIVQIQCDSIPVAEEMIYLMKHFGLWISVLPKDANIELQVVIKTMEEEE